MDRKEFLQIGASAVILLANGKILAAHNYLNSSRRKILFRFVIASDGHYGQKDTDYENYFAQLVSRINEEHQKDKFEFCMVNGDIIHDDASFLPSAKAALDKLTLKYYVTQGNHDHASQELWESTWKIPLNYDFTIKNTAFLAATTSDEAGKYLCPDLAWFEKKLKEYKAQKNIFVIIHINPAKLTTHGIDCPEFVELIRNHKNVRAIFNGHDHNEEGIKKKFNIPFIFDAHFGGNWGTAYRGFRVVEVMKDGSVLSYILNPFEKINEIRI